MTCEQVRKLSILIWVEPLHEIEVGPTLASNLKFLELLLAPPSNSIFPREQLTGSHQFIMRHLGTMLDLSRLMLSDPDTLYDIVRVGVNTPSQC